MKWLRRVKPLHVWLLIIGFGVGWLMGLSVSPVVSIVITSVTASAAAIIAALSGLEGKPDQAQQGNGQQLLVSRWTVDPLPLMVLVIGIVGGSLLGIKARNDSWLGSPVSIEVKRWTDAGLVGPDGLNDKELVRRLFESQYYTGTATLAGNAPTSVTAFPALGTVLFSISSSDCERLIAGSAQWFAKSDPVPLENALRTSSEPKLQQLPDIITDTQTLAEVVDKVICANGPSQP